MTCNQRTSRPRVRINTVPHIGNFMNEFFNTAVGDVLQKSDRKHFTNPATNVLSFDDRYELEVALPGFNKEDIEIKIDNGLLTISANEKTEEDVKVNYRLREFNYSGFKKSFTLPDSANPAKIKASLKKGLLQIVIPKKEEAIPQPSRKISIK